MLYGVVKLALDRMVSNLQINELDFNEGAEKVIFSKQNVSEAEAEKAGGDYSVFIVYVYPDETQARRFVEERRCLAMRRCLNTAEG